MEEGKENCKESALSLSLISYHFVFFYSQLAKHLSLNPAIKPNLAENTGPA